MLGLEGKVMGRFLVFLVALAFAFDGQAQQATEKHLSFGVVPQHDPEKMARQWAPLMAYLSKQAGVTIRFSTAPSIPEFERRLAEGVYDLAYMNPYHFTVFNERPGYRAMARQNNHVIKGILVVSKDARASSLRDLKGKSLAFPAPHAFAATLITRAQLEKTAPGYKASFVQSHDSVYRAVSEGLFAAGGGIHRTLGEMEPAIRKKIRVLWESAGFTGHAIASHPSMPEEQREAILGALLSMSSTQAGQELLENIGMAGFVEAVGSDWDDVRRLGLGVPLGH
ncbi:phosphate/phosphite/phosphonate ABC transporter substrate-binding protein [Marinobacter daepoensis]|uniref:phosphate/phosphite/phosphonate ABC transporter substrate-binding protein n=1 Tax=Marinobacter daepoensis TaxID=262077 RepID=UPI000566EA11|nr:phosphate/phosphite/phosphonate ABC transporter substrate-binding protein [Marinobacter daepoensis]